MADSRWALFVNIKSMNCICGGWTGQNRFLLSLLLVVGPTC